MRDHCGTGVLRSTIRRWRIGNRNLLTDTIEVLAHVFPLPSLGPTAIEYLRRIGLKQHAVEHAIAAQSDSLKRKRRLSELVGHTERLKCHLRILAWHVEDCEIVASRGQPRYTGSATSSRRRRSTSFDDEDPLSSSAGQPQLGGYDATGRAAANNNRVVSIDRRIDIVAASAPQHASQGRCHTQRQTGLSALTAKFATVD